MAVLAIFIGCKREPPDTRPELADWLPLRPGKTWSYSVTRRREVVLPGREPQTAKQLESRTFTVLGKAKDFPGGIRLSERIEVDAPDVDDRVRTRMIVVSASEDGVRLLANWNLGSQTANKKLSTYDPPLLLFPLPLNEPQEWKTGERREAELKFATDSKFVGREDVELLGGTFPHTYRLTSTAAVSGSIHLDGKLHPVTSGTETTSSNYTESWLLVRRNTEQALTIRLRNGKAATLTETSTIRLKPGYRIPAK